MLVQFTRASALRKFVQEKKRLGRRIGFVPTMGYLHDGHLSLIKAAKRHADVVIASIFVNPTQFAVGEDLDSYPRDIEGDVHKLAIAGADAVFLPSEQDMYDGGPSVSVSIPALSVQLCGESRPTHFAGVCQVVLKLFGLVQCDVAVFGQKDFQQLTVIRRLVDDLFLPIQIVGAPIIREADGLAMSSRNVYLSPAHRPQAAVLFRSLSEMRAAARNGERDIARLKSVGLSVMESSPDASLDYLEIVHRNTLEPLLDSHAVSDAHVLIAARFGTTRLIDNLSLAPEVN